MWSVTPVVAAMLAAGISINTYAATAAGTQIKNLATVTYEDSAGNTFTAQSNEAVVTVAQIYSATVNTNNTTVAASPGQPVDIPYTLENTGNGTDVYQLAAADEISTPDTLDADNIQIFEDLNENGQADAGEPVVSSIVLNAGEVKNLVVRADVPVNATEADTLGVTLTAEAEEGTGSPVPLSVIDATNGPDGLNSTVETLIEVTGDAVVVASKDSVHDAAANQITYTLTIRNNGNSDATDVLIQDGIPANTTLVPGSITTSGLLASNTDALPTLQVLSETGAGLDFNNDGDALDAAVDAIVATDALLPSNATITVTYTVAYDPAIVPGGTTISNVAFITPDVDGDGTRDATISTNQVNDIVGDVLIVSITDTGEATGGDGVNDGQDDDAANDIQLVDTIAAGERVLFRNVVTNSSNVDDILELSVENDSFPAGTVFTFWNDTATVQLNDTNGADGVDLGLVAAGASETITVIAQLPATFSGAGDFDATVTVTSDNDRTVFDTVTERLSIIEAATVDIHNSAAGTLDVDDNPLGAPDFSAVNTTIADNNTTVNIPLYIDNDRDVSSTFELTVGSVYDPATDSVSGLPNGWTVDFFEVDDVTGLPTGSPITTTPSIPGRTANYELIAVVTIPSDQTLATGDFASDNDADGTIETLDGNGDNDGDYPFFFQITSTTGATDVTVEAIDVTQVISASLTPNGAAQIDPGSSEVYTNILTNTGNATATYEVERSNSQVGWSNTLSVDTDGDGIADTEMANLSDGDVISVLQPDGLVADIEITLSNADNPEFTLDAGESLPLTSTVFSPANAPDGQIDVLTINATDVATGDVVTAQNQSQVVTGQVRIEKLAAIDTDCDGTADTTFAAAQPTTVEPNQCVIWEITAENQGSSVAENVIIRDAVPAFTTFEAGSLNYCLNLNCPLLPAGPVGEENAGDIVFYIGTGSVPGTRGGELVAGDQATVTFSVRVD